MNNKDYCCSSFLAFRYIVNPDADFAEYIHHRKIPELPNKDDATKVSSSHEVDDYLKTVFNKIKDKKLGILLSGGMDSACLASYMPKGSNAYTFRFLGGKYDSEELHRAEEFAKVNGLNLHYVDIDWGIINECLPVVMKNKGAPVHSIEPQLYSAAMQAKSDGVEVLIYGDAADYVFYGMDGLLSQDWNFDDFYKRAIYIEPSEVLANPVDIKDVFEKYRQGNKINFIGFYDKEITEESYGSYDNAFASANMLAIDPYEKMKMAEPVDLERTRAGDSKYYIRELFHTKYPNIQLPEKHPMPRPVDEYFKDWKGPTRSEFRKDIDMSKYSGNQKWLLWCLERFLDTL